jgi:hypothetical protein
MCARDSELVVRNRERIIEMMQNKQLIKRQTTLMIHYKDTAKDDLGELYTTQTNR